MMINEKITGSDIGIFLGAGASAPFGKLLMDGFVAAIENKENLSKDERSFLRFLFEKKGIDLEEVLEDIRMFMDKDYYTQGKEVGIFEYFSHHFSDILNIARRLDLVIRKEIIEHYRYFDDIDLVLKTYNPVFELIQKEINKSPITIPVFTTNYDTAIERVCYEQDDKFSIVDGSKFEIRHMCKVLSLKEFANFKPQPDKLNVVSFKLHGSICWEEDKRSGFIRVISKPIFDDPDPDVRKVYIVPTKAKIAHSYPYRLLYEYLQRSLDRAKLFIFIGYSFRDYDSLTKIKSSLDFNPDLKLLILDPRADAIRNELFKDYKKRIVPIPLFFGVEQDKYLEIISKELKNIGKINTTGLKTHVSVKLGGDKKESRLTSQQSTN